MSIQFRPTFSIPIGDSETTVWESIRSAVEQDERIVGQFRQQHASLAFVESQRHFWSPWLHLDVRTQDEQKLLFGRFSPHPSVWTAFAFSYLAFGVIAFFSAIVGLSQQIAAEPAWAYWGMPICITLGILFWLASQMGQRLAQQQMIELKTIVDTAIES